MAKKITKKHVSKPNAKLKAGELERRKATKAILGDTDDFLIVTGPVSYTHLTLPTINWV